MCIYRRIYRDIWGYRGIVRDMQGEKGVDQNSCWFLFWRLSVEEPPIRHKTQDGHTIMAPKTPRP